MEEVKCPIESCLDKMTAEICARHGVKRLSGHIVTSVIRGIIQQRVEDEVRQHVGRMKTNDLLKLSEMVEEREFRYHIAEKKAAEAKYNELRGELNAVPSQADALMGVPSGVEMEATEQPVTPPAGTDKV